MATERTPEEKLAEITKYLTDKRDRNLEVTKTFASALMENADYQFGWADRAMFAAATERVTHITLEAIRMSLEAGKRTAAEIIADAHRYALEKTFYAAQHPERSTSPSSNAMSQFRGQAWAELREYLSHY